MLVVAGAGSGKTTVLAQRMANLIQTHHVSPEQILAVTYTENAAENLRKRVQQYLGDDFDSSKLQARTFHSYCADLAGRHGRRSTWWMIWISRSISICTLPSCR